jgi:ubiquinone/menaquinone biosynthesis C-methylase UbiE
MNTLINQSEDLKKIVKEKYAEIADQSREQNISSACGCGCSVGTDALMAEDYSSLKGYSSDADLGLGCGLPTVFAQIEEGDTVVDLGSGAGNDAFVARSVAGASGKVIGVDFTEKMVTKAQLNAEKLGYNNVEFRYGDIESMPVNSNAADVVVSNCVLNLVPNKQKAFEETFRILKPGGHFSVSDIVMRGNLPEKFKTAAELYSGCVAGAIDKYEYLEIIRNAGFENIQIQKEKQIVIPDELLKQYGTEEEIKEFRACGVNILSITVYADKPGTREKKAMSIAEKAEKKAACCGTDSKCC